ncbi:acetoacetate--CoA ligase [Lacihabitans lacunae]|uniref:Acetoacetate--CoA ligase n=1 Tax=Lacihabitans lacunae TaxID=1028214 RepID=A0ABV7YVP4_9BACT
MSKLLWSPTESYMSESELYRFQVFLEKKQQLVFNNYQEMWAWSIDKPADFWRLVLAFFDIQYSGSFTEVLIMPESGMIGTKWFEGISLNYAEHIFRNATAERPAVIFKKEGQAAQHISWETLGKQVRAIQHYLLKNGLQIGDRVAGYLTNSPDTLAVFLAVNACGGIWSCVSPDFGLESIIDRFQQITPKFLFFDQKYTYNGKLFDKSSAIESLLKQLPSVEHAIEIGGKTWNEILTENTEGKTLVFKRVPFSHPIWILYSSGTTGKPKAITHSTGGNLLEHYKALAFHQNLKSGERFFWYSTTGWMMWNYSISSLLVGATLCLYEGSPSFPENTSLWDFAAENQIDHFGGGAAYYIHSMKSKLELSDISLNLKTIGSTGSPLSEEAFDWLNVNFPTTQIISLSGGTDVCSAFVSGCPFLPVYSGQIQCRTLGSAVFAYSDSGEELVNEPGELVITKPMPSMPVYFWNDENNQKYHDSYFGNFEGIWSHGDLVEINQTGGVIIHGRSDATLNRGGVRIGTAEIYKVIDGISEIQDSLVVCIDYKDGSSLMKLFIKMKAEEAFGEDLIKRIKTELRSQFSPRHVPDEVLLVKDIPYTVSGKKMEIPVKRLLMNYPLEKAVSLDAMRNPESIQWFLEYRKV